MHRMPQPTWGRAGTHTPKEGVHWLNTIIFMTSQCNRSFGKQNQKRPYKIINPICWFFLDPFYVRDIQKNSLFLGYSLTLFSEGVSKFYGHFFLDTICVWFHVFFLTWERKEEFEKQL